jgi:hypothetical protein
VPVEVRRATPADWPRLKALRLEALADTPIGFLETLEQAEQLEDGVWQARAARGAEGGDSLQVVAWDGGRPVGTCVSFVGDGRAWPVAVYVSPTALVLEVHEDNARARAAYDELGFVETGATRPYPLDPSRSELEMVLPLR